ncbi:MAG: 60 kDa chaperonin [Planctomycetota bacterium]|jgi:chaperonin GroEL
MGNKHLLFHSAAREKVLHGAGTLADAVRVTLGPRSKCVLIGRKWGRPIVCNDGVTIAREMELKDPEENLGAQMIRQAAEKTGDVVGDGTSTSTVLAQAILGEGIRNVAAGASAIDLKRGLDLGLKIAIDAIKELSRPVESTREKAQVATISAHNDPVLGELVAKAMEKVGREGVVSVEEAKGIETTLEVVEGMQFDRGYLSPYFITEPEKMQAILEEPFILAYEKKISIMKDLLPLLEQLAQARKSLLLIAEDIDGEALATLVVNKVRGVVGCIAVKAPGYGDRRREMMGDLAVLTGGKFISEELGLRLENLKLEDLGKAQRVVCDRDNTMIIGGVGSKAAIEGRCTEIRNQISKSTSEYDREKFQERLARLSGGVAVIKVGAPSEAEMKSRKEALEDAISSTKAAMAEGIVPGGGLTLLRAIDAMEKQENTFHGDEQTGLRILKKALEAPTRTIAENSGMDGGVVVAQMRNGTGNFGFDASKGQYLDLVQAGIIDPTKVVRTALENAVSVASLLLLTEVTMTEMVEPKTEIPQTESAFEAG